MEAETYPLRLKRFPFLGWFDGTVVSGREGVAKPEPAVFTRLLDRFGLKPRMTLMIDDTEENLDACMAPQEPPALVRGLSTCYSAPTTLKSWLTKTWWGQLTPIWWTSYSPLLSFTTRSTTPPG